MQRVADLQVVCPDAMASCVLCIKHGNQLGCENMLLAGKALTGMP